MRCDECGNEFEGNFCSQCGAKATQSVESVSVEAEREVSKVVIILQENAIMNVMEAIKVIREITGCDLKTSKDLVAQLRGGMKIEIEVVDINKAVASLKNVGIIAMVKGKTTAINDSPILEEKTDANKTIEASRANTMDNIESAEEQKIKRKRGALLDNITDIILGIILTVLLIRYNCSSFLIVAFWALEIINRHLEKQGSKKAQKIVTVIGVVIVLYSISQIYNGYQNERYVEVVHEQQYMGVEYEELFENFSNDVEWECIEDGRFTTVDPNEPDRSGSFDAVVTVSGGCYVYDEETTYTLKFNVSKEDNRAVPIELQLYGTMYYSSDEIHRFMDSVYINYVEYIDNGN